MKLTLGSQAILPEHGEDKVTCGLTPWERLSALTGFCALFGFLIKNYNGLRAKNSVRVDEGLL
jgi:hypothetical protein